MNRKNLFLLPVNFLFLFNIFINTSVFARAPETTTQPPNLGLIKLQILNYIESGNYERDISRIVEQARAYLKARVLSNKSIVPPKKLAIVLDIDDTALSNLSTLLKVDFSRNQKYFCPGAFETPDKAIPQVLSLYNEAKKHGVAVFFISGRSTDGLESTAESLKNVGFNHWDGLFLIPPGYKNKEGKYSISSYKEEVRQKITSEGYDIVLNLGDQDSDFVGGFSEKNFKLPNPFYYTP
ncbi:HAD family acid phosphatase [Legionella sp. CNM-1927-20]|uniref:HAD family acid phosphatase n=1 Tax=Legionella sp. CNM-1927-20 TaxID=3422221 RepID=UPI00403A8314